MPRKPRRCTIKTEPMKTRSLTRAKQNIGQLLNNSPVSADNMPELASLIAAALDITSLKSASVSKKDISASKPVKIAPTPVSAVKEVHVHVPAPTLSPSKEHRPKRRKREPIQLPPGVAIAKLSAKDVRRLKNRIAATRLRQRSQQSIRSLEEQMEFYRSRCEFLEIVMSGCATCSSLSAMQFSDIELIPMETIKAETAVDEDEPTILTEVECVVLDKVLHN